MIEICRKMDCTGCGVCADFCPTSCIRMVVNEEGFAYPVIDENQCIRCFKCRKSCHLNQDWERKPADFYMAWHREDEVRRKSSSGGVFSALAELVLNHQGVVVGAAMDEKTQEVRHVMIDHKKDLDKLRLSKYDQSDTSQIFQKVIACLDEHRYVLFSGTSCQIAALKSVVRRNREYLLTVDIFCHGVTSKKVVDAYIKEKEAKYGKKIVRYYFRAKEDKDLISGRGWAPRMKLDFSDGTSVAEDRWDERKSVKSTFTMGYDVGILLRESCYHCRYCGTERISDFTIADFWGVTESRAPQEEIRKGISLLLANTDRAKELLEELKRSLVMTPIDSEEAVPYNWPFTAPVSRPKQREKFFRGLEKGAHYDRLVIGVYRQYRLKKRIREGMAAFFKKIFGSQNYEKAKSFIKTSILSKM